VTLFASNCVFIVIFVFKSGSEYQYLFNNYVVLTELKKRCIRFDLGHMPSEIGMEPKNENQKFAL
jgi:hypothetical protein